MKHTMIDVETMGGPGCAILSIGAVEFDPNAQAVLGRTFYTNISLESCVSHGLKIDPATVMWWLSQSDVARASLLTPNPLTLYNALTSFSAWFNPDTEIWAHGASFDFSVLAHPYKLLYGSTPWKYKNERDDRTLFALSGLIYKNTSLMAHNALEDAKMQALGCVEAMRIIKLND